VPLGGGPLVILGGVPPTTLSRPDTAGMEQSPHQSIGLVTLFSVTLTGELAVTFTLTVQDDFGPTNPLLNEKPFAVAATVPPHCDAAKPGTSCMPAAVKSSVKKIWSNVVAHASVNVIESFDWLPELIIAGEKDFEALSQTGCATASAGRSNRTAPRPRNHRCQFGREARKPRSLRCVILCSPAIPERLAFKTPRMIIGSDPAGDSRRDANFPAPGSASKPPAVGLGPIRYDRLRLNALRMLNASELAARRGTAELFSGVTFALERGQALVVSGRNGSGKTTLLRILAGMTSPTAGTLQWNSESVVPFSRALREALTYVGHAAALKDDLTAEENLASLCALAGDAVPAQELDDALSAVALDGQRRLMARVLSQGQRRRIGLARLVVSRRPLWLLDEPATALDADGLALLAATLNRHLDRGGLAVCATHQPLDLPGARRQTLSLDHEAP